MRLVAPQPVWADVDAFRIERVVCNLVDNALRYSPEHTGVVVRLERRDDDVRVSVADRGPGLSDDIAAALFASLGRRAPGGDIGGHGIGLRVSKRIIDAHGGTLAVHSTPGVGSTFYFDLPLR
jgi:signal transduction histidine kinase